MTKVIAKGGYQGAQVTVCCIQDNEEIHVYFNGNEDLRIKLLLDRYADDREIQFENSHVYSAPRGTIEAYWLALHETLFDSPPDSVTVEGEIDLQGAPYVQESEDNIIYYFLYMCTI